MSVLDILNGFYERLALPQHVWDDMTPNERTAFLIGMGLGATALTYAVLKKPEVIPETVKGIGSIVEGVVPL